METPSYRNTFLSTYTKYRQSYKQICNGNPAAADDMNITETTENEPDANVTLPDK